ncbi:MAG: ATP-binding protein [Simkaniaceae bacterium]|nr:ATP-binding protein [Candidatus Sacchlamyda saccharinae]
MKAIIGRKKEQNLLREILTSKEAEFLAIYGRRRVGKTFLIREYFSKKGFYFELTGEKDGSKSEQLKNFAGVLGEVFGVFQVPRDWKEAFEMLTLQIKKIPKKKKCIIFLDELPWLAGRKSGFLQALDYYWNRHWSGLNNVILIACGSAASWMLTNLVNAKGGLHNRLTRVIRLEPFSIKCTQRFLLHLGLNCNIKQLCDIYMAVGGVPYYLKQFSKGRSAMQNINRICFQKEGILFSEFDRLFASLFDQTDLYVEIVQTIGEKTGGVSRDELLKKLSFASGGRINHRLEELEVAGFIQGFVPYGKKRKNKFYRLIDEYVLFYLHWILPIKKRGLKPIPNYWKTKMKTPKGMVWAALSFEAMCLKHIDLIYGALDLEGIHAEVGSWRFAPKKGGSEAGAQIDLLIDREDGLITICEIKYSQNLFAIDKSCARSLINKIEVFEKHFSTKKQVSLTMITLYGVKESPWASELVDDDIAFAELITK